MVSHVTYSVFRWSKYKNINSSIMYYVLTITLDVSSIGTHTHLLAFVIYYSIIRLYCLQPIVLDIILTQGMSWMYTFIHVDDLKLLMLLILYYYKFCLISLSLSKRKNRGLVDLAD